MVVVGKDDAEGLIRLYREQLFDAKSRLNSARTLKEVKFFQSKITFLTDQISEINGGKQAVRKASVKKKR